MNTRTKSLGWMAMAALVALPGLNEPAHGQQGPVRQGIRGAAEVTGRAVRRTGEATRNVVGGVARGTAKTVRRTGEAARNLGQGTREALRGSTQPYRGRYGAGYRGDVQQGVAHADAQYQGQAGYDQGASVEGAWHSMESNQGYANTGQVHPLRHDRCGREFICLNGQRVYFTSQAGYQQSQPEHADWQNEQNGQDAYETRRPISQEDPSRQSIDPTQSDRQAANEVAVDAQTSDNQSEKPSDSEGVDRDEVDRSETEAESADSDS